MVPALGYGHYLVKIFPSSFLTLQGEQSMLQDTVTRLSGIEHQAALIICNEAHRFTVAEQYRAKK